MLMWAESRSEMATELERVSRKRKISADFPPPTEDDEEVIGPMPVEPDKGIKKKKGERTFGGKFKL